ncbi:MAG: hypothetical protein IT449_08765 [Phycisphaerales bacterium]|nr:hypothetical protein [Phycisphaerales bacterium]
MMNRTRLQGGGMEVSRKYSFVRCASAWGCAVLLALASGCQTDALFRSGRSPKADRVIVAQTLAPRQVDEDFLHNAKEADLAEEVVTHRDAYVSSLRSLRDAYAAGGNTARRDQAAAELAGLEKVQQFHYMLDAEVPPVDLKPTLSIPEADRLYASAVKLMKQGGSGIPGLYRQEKMLEALNAFKSVINLYPTSDKIDDAAFYAGEIHKEYFPEQELIAVRWYERSMLWNPKTPHPVRFQAAVIYDYRLHDRARALELYHGVLEQEKDIDLSNTRFSSRRIDELMREPRPAATESSEEDAAADPAPAASGGA